MRSIKVRLIKDIIPMMTIKFRDSQNVLLNSYFHVLAINLFTLSNILFLFT